MKIRLDDVLGAGGKAVITRWHAGENAQVNEGEELVEIVTDKATFDVSSPCSGTLVRIMKKEGQEAGPGEDIAELLEDPVRGESAPGKTQKPQRG
ncbi:MAG: lipoyl domain-containing protein [Candidatus Omnitrophota bacterium]